MNQKAGLGNSVNVSLPKLKVYSTVKLYTKHIVKL